MQKREPRSRDALARAVAVGALLLSSVYLLGCEQRYWVCDEVAPGRRQVLPKKLSETGLFDDIASEALGPGVTPYAPRFQLWSDGATKRRWLRLPADTRVDSHDMDAWVFPEGTQLWKEFTRDGVRVETRLLQKIGPRDDDWAAIAYLWTDDQEDAYAIPYGAIDARGTPHNVPAASECMACHGGTKSRVLGVSAIQLGGDPSRPGLTLEKLADQGLLSAAPDDLELVLPGTPVEQAALGYLHANCSHCHNQSRPPHDGARCFDPENELDFHLAVTDLASTQRTATYLTMGRVVRPGQPGKSRLIDLVSHRGFFKQMPPLASERIDDEAVALLRDWIATL
jgi:hypothetical protein